MYVNMELSNANDENAIIICRVNRKIFQYSFLWPDDGTELNPGKRYTLKILKFVVITGIISGLNLIYCCLAIKNSKPLSAEDIAETIASYGNYYMVWAYVRKQREIAILLRDLSNFNRFGKPPGFEEEDRRLNLGVKILISYSFASTIYYALMKYFYKDECKRVHAYQKSDGNFCGLIAPIWWPFELDYFPVFYIWFIYLLLCAHLLIKMCTHISYNALEIAHHIILRLKHLQLMIIECFEEQSNIKQQEKFLKCITYHIDILHMTARLENIFFNSMFGHLALTGGICACLEKQVVDGHNVYAGTLHLLGWFMALFVGCFGGQHVLDANDIVPEGIWTSKWYQSNLRLRKDIVFMIMRSQKNFYLRAGSFGVLCYPLFVSVLKTSYSIFCMLTS